MSTELAESLDPSVPQAEIDAAETPAEPQEKAQEAETAEPEGEVEAKPEKPPKGFVPQGALHEERQRRKELQAEVQRIQQAQEQQRQIMEQRLQAIQQAQWQAQQPKPPSYDEDPVAALKHGVDSTQAELAQLRQWQAFEQQRAQKQAQEREYLGKLESTVKQDVAAFRAENPDYEDALSHARQVRYQQHIAVGLNEAEAAQLVLNEEYQLADEALRRGKSPAETVYNIAKAYGYQKKAPQDSQQKIETLQKGVKASQSLGSGGTPSGKMTMDQLAEMGDEDFAQFMREGKWKSMGN